jgi:hypothetical protein
VPLHDRHEIVVAVLGSAAVVLGTLFLIWLMRPGPTSSIGKGGILNRQPRAGWLLVITIAAILGILYFALRPDSRVRRKVVVVVSSVVIIVLAAGGVAWAYPGGVVHHYPSAPKPPPTAPSVVPPLTTSTSPAGTPTTAKSATTLPTATTKPVATTAPKATTPTT